MMLRNESRLQNDAGFFYLPPKRLTFSLFLLFFNEVVSVLTKSKQRR